MKSFVRITITILLILIGVELSAPLLANARVMDENAQCAQADIQDATAIVQAPSLNHEHGCADHCGLPAHMHICQFPPSAFHECVKRFKDSNHQVKVLTAPAASHVRSPIKPPILI